MAFNEFGLFIVQVQVRWRTDHVQIDDAFGAWRMVQTDGRLGSASQERPECQPAQA